MNVQHRPTNQPTNSTICDPFIRKFIKSTLTAYSSSVGDSLFMVATCHCMLACYCRTKVYSINNLQYQFIKSSHSARTLTPLPISRGNASVQYLTAQHKRAPSIHSFRPANQAYNHLSHIHHALGTSSEKSFPFNSTTFAKDKYRCA